MNAPTRQDFDRAMSYAQENVRLGDAAADAAERHGRRVQAAQALSNAARIMSALAAVDAPAGPAPAPVMNLAAPGRPEVFAPGPR